jgi:hypothetical protein
MLRYSRARRALFSSAVSALGWSVSPFAEGKSLSSSDELSISESELAADRDRGPEELEERLERGGEEAAGAFLLPAMRTV